MKRIEQHKKISAALTLALFASIVFGSTAWATVSFLKPTDAARYIEEGKISEIPQTLPEQSKSRAPEPTTMALFGGGILGMIVSLIRKTYETVKRAFDIIISITALIVLSPLFLLAGALIKLTSKGSIFFTQTRVGKDGKLFNIYKFRTMRVDAEKETGPVWAAANDTRLIPVGSFLRKSHMDEIPQFLNVLKGEMSFIGPRPERPIFVEKFKEIIPNYEKRLTIKPGITGLAQVWHKYDETVADVRKKIKYDLLYVKKICLWTDLTIFFRTFRVVLSGKGAR